jgi:hypothetical protein
VTTLGRASGQVLTPELVRGIAALVAAVVAALAIGYLLQWPIATATWPFPVTPLTYTFLAAYAMGLVAALTWVAVTGELAGLAGIGYTVGVAYGVMTLVLVGMLNAGRDVVVNLAAAVVLCVVGGLVAAYGVMQRARDERPTPRPLPAVYLVVAVLLLTLGLPLLLRWPDVMPWDLDPDSGALIGALFTGSAAYFVFGALRRGWANAAGPLAALLAYDLVLIVPLIQHVPVARPEHMTVLPLYIAVLASSGLLGTWMFAIDRRTRWGSTSAS